MEKIKVGELDFTKMSKLNDDLIDSDIFIYNDKMYKLFKKRELYQGSEDIEKKLEYLKQLNGLVKYVKIDRLITFLNSIIGYEMEFFKDYMSFDDTLYDNDINISLRKKLSKYSITELKKMHENNFVHTDFHIGNIITNKEDILLVDPESFLHKTMCDDKEFEYQKILDIKNSIFVVLSYIYKYDFELLNLANFKDLISNQLHISPTIREYIISIINNDKTMKNIYIDELIDDYEDDKVEYDCHKVLSKYR